MNDQTITELADPTGKTFDGEEISQEGREIQAALNGEPEAVTQEGKVEVNADFAEAAQ